MELLDQLSIYQNYTLSYLLIYFYWSKTVYMWFQQHKRELFTLVFSLSSRVNQCYVIGPSFTNLNYKKINCIKAYFTVGD